MYVCSTMGSGRGREAWVRERVEWSLCFFLFFFLWWLVCVCVCNKVRHVIEEEVCYLTYLRGRQDFFFFFFGFERVLYSISKVPSGTLGMN